MQYTCVCVNSFALVVAYYNWGRYNGHYNPIITLAYLLKGDKEVNRDEWFRTIFYWCFQFVGSIVGAFLAYLMGGRKACLVHPIVDEQWESEAFRPFFAELFFSALIVSTYYHCHDPCHRKQPRMCIRKSCTVL